MKYLYFFVLLFFACGGGKQETSTNGKFEPGTYMFISVKDFGTIVIKMHEKYAPNNVNNIVTLANKGFYDGLTFHRIIPGFVIQGGCPRGDGTGNPGYRIDDEITPALKHLKGTVAMANAGPNTNGCQFYICLEPLPRLDGSYTIIGQVVKGMDVVDAIGQVETGPNDRPKEPVVMDKVWIEKH
jgi:peptidyl-prolyl cis-trans isomerase B (cyclophilin B)